MARRAGPADMGTTLKRAVRTCIGCRGRAAATDLVRVVLRDHEVVVDVARTAPGRGASLHRDPACLALAERRRAFGRALRASGGQPGIEQVRQYVANFSTNHGAEPVSVPTEEAGRSGMSTR